MEAARIGSEQKLPVGLAGLWCQRKQVQGSRDGSSGQPKQTPSPEAGPLRSPGVIPKGRTETLAPYNPATLGHISLSRVWYCEGLPVTGRGNTGCFAKHCLSFVNQVTRTFLIVDTSS